MRSLRVQLRLLELGLLLPVLVTGAFGLAYLKAVAAQRRAVEQAGLVLVRRAMDRIVAVASERGNEAAALLLAPVVRTRSPSARQALESMRRTTDSLRACRCGPIKEGAYFFYWVPSTGEFASSVPLPTAQDPRTLLRGTVAGIPRGARGIWGAGGMDSTGPWLIHFAKFAVDDRAEAVVGFDISMASWWRDTFQPAIVAARHELFPMLPSPERAIGIVLSNAGREVVGTTTRYAGPSASVDLIPGTGYTLEVTLNPTILPTVFAVANPPGYPLLAGALVASVLASVLALVLLRQMRRAMAQREAFVASISHELRTPLTEVLLHAESLHLHRDTPEANARAATSIVRETRRLIGLVENTLSIAGAGRVPNRDPAVILAAPVVRESLRCLEPAAADRRVRIEASLDEEARCSIDTVSLDRIVTNLVENAIRYGPEGQTVRVVLGRSPGGCRLEVGDEGPGVPLTERARIWEPFARGTAGRAATAGLGLGLAIIKHLVEAVGGKATVETGPAGGARFVISLPANAPA
ncbi:MAG: HAMP domain-containing histidine kinase [Gemmatimonadales bacterium]|nr:HAMP domain-containing histidine kinase [Gemmatimonadales bacterium]